MIREWKASQAAFLLSDIYQQGDAVSRYCAFCMQYASWPQSAISLPVKSLSCYTLCAQRKRA